MNITYVFNLAFVYMRGKGSHVKYQALLVYICQMTIIPLMKGICFCENTMAI